MLNDFSWNMTGYIPKHAVNPSDDGIPPYVAERIFQLEPEPPTVDNPNEYILSALREKDLKYFSFFLHHYELQLNKRIKTFQGSVSAKYLFPMRARFIASFCASRNLNTSSNFSTSALTSANSFSVSRS